MGMAGRGHRLRVRRRVGAVPSSRSSAAVGYTVEASRCDRWDRRVRVAHVLAVADLLYGREGPPLSKRGEDLDADDRVDCHDDQYLQYSIDFFRLSELARSHPNKRCEY